MSYDTPRYAVRTAIKDALRAAGLTQGEFARRAGLTPPSFRNKLNGNDPMDSLEEKKILADIEAMKGAGG